MARDLQTHILNTASDLFYRQGIKNTGVDAIVKAAGTTKMSLYKYFPSKDDLVLAHLEKSRKAIEQSLLQGVEKHIDPKDKLLAIFDVFAELQAQPWFRGCPFINAAAEFAEEKGPVRKATAEYSKWFRKFLVALAQDAGIGQPEQLAGYLAMLIAGAMTSEQMRRGSQAMHKARKAAEILISNFVA